MDYKNLTSPCGLACWNCLLYKAKDNEQIRAAIAQKTGRPAEQCSCQGCRAHNGTIPFLGMTEPCKVYRCITQKGIEICSDCDEFPCKNLHPIAEMANTRPHNLKVYNLCQIRRLGLEEWAEELAEESYEHYFKGTLTL